MATVPQAAPGIERHYRAQIASPSAVRLAFGGLWHPIARHLDEGGRALAAPEELHGWLTSPELAAAYASVVPCVEAMVLAQLGERAPGWLPQGPRLADAFSRRRWDDAARRAFGPLIEGQIRGGYAGAAVATAGFVRPRVVEFPEEVLLRLAREGAWGGHGLTGDQLRLRARCEQGALRDEAVARGLLRDGWRRRDTAREADLLACMTFWLDAGSTLFMISSDASPEASWAGVRARDPRGPGDPRPPLAAEVPLGEEWERRDPRGRPAG